MEYGIATKLENKNPVRLNLQIGSPAACGAFHIVIDNRISVQELLIQINTKESKISKAQAGSVLIARY